jgi:hypothetical protein
MASLLAEMDVHLDSGERDSRRFGKFVIAATMIPKIVRA